MQFLNIILASFSQVALFLFPEILMVSHTAANDLPVNMKLSERGVSGCLPFQFCRPALYIRRHAFCASGKEKLYFILFSFLFCFLSSASASAWQKLYGYIFCHPTAISFQLVAMFSF